MDFAKAKVLAETSATDYVGKPKKDCPSKKSCLIVVVYKHDTNEVIKSAKVQVSGTATDAKGKTSLKSKSDTTDRKGIAKFKPWDPGDYNIDISIPKIDGYEKPDLTHQTVASGTCPVVCVPVKPLPKLKVKVVQKGNHSRVFSDATVTLVSAPQTHPDKSTQVGIADYGRTQSGKYVVKLTALKEEDRKDFVVPRGTVEETLSSGDDKTVIIEVEKINVVTPKIEMEYKVVLYDRKLWKYQEATEEKIYPDPTYIQLSFRQTDPSKPFQKGGKVKFSPANVEVYLDEECKKKASGDPASGINLKFEEISNLSGHNLYLRGKTAGKFKVIFELTDPNDPLIRLDKNPAEEEMGVVEIKMRVYEHDAAELAKIKIDPDTDPISTYYTNLKDKELPKQVVLEREKKVKVGRLLHVQKDKNHGRARVVVKINPDEWPSGTDAYKIGFDKEKTSGDVELFDKEWEGDEKGSFTVSTVKAKEQTLWLEGKTTTTKKRDVRLYLTLDRAVYGLAKTPKKNADWARITVVEIKEVKLTVTTQGTDPVVWDSGRKRFYINTDDDPSGRELKTKASVRDIKVTAELTEKLDEVTIHFMLAADPANWDNTGVPAGWEFEKLKKLLKHTDKADRKDLLHVSAKTDAEGIATIDKLVLSAIGGHKFKIGAYIDQDPHLAKFVDGHPDDALSKKKPVLSTDAIEIWRRIQYQYDAMQRDGGGDYSDKKDDAGFTTEYANAFIEMEGVGDGTPAHRRVLGDDQVATWAAANSSKPLNTPRYTYMALIDSVGGGGPQEETIALGPVAGGDVWEKPLVGYTIDNSAPARYLVSGSGQAWRATGPVIKTPLSDNAFLVVTDGDDFILEVDLSGKSNTHNYMVEVKIIKYTSISGLSSGNVSLVDMRYKENNFAAEAKKMALNTLLHEVGHFLGLSGGKRADDADTNNPLWYNNPGVGNHCNHNTDGCVMFHEGSLNVAFCPTCNRVMRARKLGAPPVWGADAF